MSTILTFDHLKPFESIIHGISTKDFGSMKNPDLSINFTNLDNFTNALNLKTHAVCMDQVHGGNLKVIDSVNERIIHNVDSLITNKKNIPLTVITADCLPILLFDPVKKVIGVVHAGYKGVLNHVIENTIGGFHNIFGSNPTDILVGIGPSIEKKCYEVGREVIDLFDQTFADFTNLYSKKDEKYLLDVLSAGMQCLLKEGILKEHITYSPLCTNCSVDSLYSYRRGDLSGRFASVISLV